MKNLLRLNILLLLSFPNALKAQAPFNTIDSLDVNNIKVSQLVHGDMWNDGNNAMCEFPKGAGKHLAFTSSLWMAGYDDQSQLRISAQTYRQNGIDFWPGPIEDTSGITYAKSQDWARIWKVDRWEIEAFLKISNHTTANTPASILEWPGKQNSYARGNNGVPLIMSNRSFAPFVDVDGNGIYEPLKGDYPEIKGDQGLWYIFNDHGPTHDASNGRPLNMEISCLAYAYKRGTAVDNIVFYEYRTICWNISPLDSFVIGVFADPDLGYGFNDYIGYDSSRNLAYVYNGTPLDTSGILGYRDSLPMAGIKVLQWDWEDTCGAFTPAQSFMYFNNNTNQVSGDPGNDVQFNHYMRARWRNGQHLHSPYVSGSTIYGDGTSTMGDEANYVYDGKTYNGVQWNECQLNNTPSDRRFVMASRHIRTWPGTVNKFAFALMATPRKYHNGCPGVNYQDLWDVADTAQKVFCNPLPIKTGIQQNLPSANKLKIYPSPATDHVVIEGDVQTGGQVKIIDALGRQITASVMIRTGKANIDVSHFSTGVYHVLISNGNNTISGSFIKE